MYKILIFLIIVTNQLFSTTAGPFNPSSAGINISIGTITWTSVTNVESLDGSDAKTGNMSNGDITNYITATNFGFAIPTASSIDGITVDIYRHDDNGVSGIKDNSVILIQNGILTGNDLSTNSSWPNGVTKKKYGGAGNLWGLTWTVADINSANFGVAVSATKTAVGVNNGFIDNITVTITYSSTLPIELISFIGQELGSGNKISWAVATQTDNAKFILERSIDALDWKTILITPGAGTTSQEMDYQYVDENPNTISYYKLTQVDYDDKSQSFDIIAVTNNKLVNFSIGPNPADRSITIEIESEFEQACKIEIINDKGQIVYIKYMRYIVGKNSIYLDISSLISGIYSLKNGIRPNIVKFLLKK
jgi:hypothetical protein